MRALRSRLILTWMLGGVAVGVSGWWAIATPEIRRADVPPKTTHPSEQPTPAFEPNQPVFDVDSLVVRLWNPPTPPVEQQPVDAAAQAAPPPPMRLQLIGIIAERGEYKAALYDPDADRIHIVTDGGTVGSIKVTSVTATIVSLIDGERPRFLELITGRVGPSS